MPHLILEYAAGPEAVIPVAALVDAVHRAARDSGLFLESHIKVRARPVSEYRVGGRMAPFVHAELRIKSGRTLEQRQALSYAVLEALREGSPDTVITVEVVEMEARSYARHYPQAPV